MGLIRKIAKTEAAPFAFLCGTKVSEYDRVPENGAKIMDALTAYAQAGKIVPQGPPVWIYEAAGKGKVRLRAGFPVKAGAKAAKPYAVEKLEAWPCLSATYKGSMENIIAAWMELMGTAKKKGIPIAGERREIYHDWKGFDAKDNVTELQIALSVAEKAKPPGKRKKV